MKFTHTYLEGVIVIEPQVISDQRGFFLEFYHEQKYRQGGIAAHFVQDNHSKSQQNVLRGLHYQLRFPQGKLMRVIEGEIFDVVVDIRQGSPTFKRWFGINLSSDNKLLLYVPPGYAHGFCVLSPTAEVTYKCTEFYRPDDEHGILWNDQDIGIDWKVAAPILSDRDKVQPLLKDAILPL